MPDEQNDTQQQIARSAAIVSTGNVLSRLMGLVREAVISGLFPAENGVGAFTAASTVPLRLYELLIGGMITSALVPTLSEYTAGGDADGQNRRELWRIASLLFTLAAVVLGGATLILELGAPLVTRMLVSGFDPAKQAETTHLLRIALLGVIFLGLSGLATALCQSLQRFALPAFTTVVLNTSMVVFALALGKRWGVRSLAAGLVVGAASQFLLQLLALRDMRFRLELNLSHPALRRILKLYLPIILGMIATELGIILDRNLASRVGEASLAYMRFATTLIQFPLGLVSMAIATATLPTLARQAVQERGDNHAFRATLAGGLRLVLILTLPSAVGLLILARPAVALIFEHGAFAASDTEQTALALRLYLIGLVFAAVDQPLVFAFYARRDTLTPALVGVLGVVFYAAVALPTYRTLGMMGLILGNGAQLGGHALAMIWLFWRRVGPLSGLGIGKTLLKAGAAAAAMGFVVYSVAGVLARWLPIEGQLRWATTVVVAGGIGAGAYLALCALLRVPELALLHQALTRLRPTR